MNTLNSILPSVIANIVFTYCDPLKEYQKRNQKKTNRLFEQMRKMTIYKMLKINDDYLASGSYSRPIEAISFKNHPTVKEMIQFPISYKKDRLWVVSYLRQKDKEEDYLQEMEEHRNY